MILQTTPKPQHRLFYYALVGIFAALTHVSAVFLFVQYAHWPALMANAIAFILAFNVSFLGHKHLSFSQLHNHKVLSLPHFFLVATSSFLINEMLYFLLLHYTQLHYLIAIVLVLGFTSMYSFLFSRYWACR